VAVKPYREGKSWSFRVRLKGQTVYRAGFSSPAAAQREADRLRQKILDAGKPKHKGPWHTTVAQALQDYARERLPAMKGARQDADRINRYLRLGGLNVVKLDKIPRQTNSGNETKLDAASVCYWEVSFVPSNKPRKIVSSLSTHRHAQTVRTEKTDLLRGQLGKMPMANVVPYLLQDLVDAMISDGYGPATIGLERAMLRRLFSYAQESWLWIAPARNPGAGLKLPPVDNVRTRIVSNDEWKLLSKALERESNPYVIPALALLLETSMRVSEPLMEAHWKDLDWGRCILHLKDGKAGARDVPLNPLALDVLRTLYEREEREADEPRILPTTYETIKAAWNRACASAGVFDAHIHDLRHTAATRFTLELNGNVMVLKVITGHKTLAQLNRYINLKADDVVRVLHGRPLTEGSAPAGLRANRLALMERAAAPSELPTNVIPLRRKVVLARE